MAAAAVASRGTSQTGREARQLLSLDLVSLPDGQSLSFLPRQRFFTANSRAADQCT